MLSIIIAQAANPEIPPWMQGSVLAVLVSLVAWWIYYVTSVAFPKMHEKQQDHIEAIVSTHGVTIKNIVDEFRNESKEQRAACAEEKRMIWDQIQTRKV